MCEHGVVKGFSAEEGESSLKVLMVLYYFPPLGGGGTQRCLKFAKYAPQGGWRPYVLTVRDSHHLAMDNSLLTEVPENLSIVRTPAILPARFFRKATKHRAPNKTASAAYSTPLRYLFDFAKNIFYTAVFIPDEFIGWMPFAVHAGQRLVRREHIHLLFSSGPPNATHIIAHQLKKKTGLPWVADLRDLWDEYPDSYNPFHLSFKRRLDDKIERRTLAAADAIVVVSETMRDQIRRKLKACGRTAINVITNGFDPADFDGIEPVAHHGGFVLTHAGSLFEWRRLEPFLRALQLFFDRHPAARRTFRLKLLGIIPDSERRIIAKMGLEESVVFHGYLPFRETLAHLLGSDVLLLLIGDLPHAANMLTSKLFDYIGAKRPILAIGPPGELHRLIQKGSLGMAISADDQEGIVKALEEFCWHRKQEAFRISPVVAGKYHRQALSASLSELFRRIVADHR